MCNCYSTSYSLKSLKYLLSSPIQKLLTCTLDTAWKVNGSFFSWFHPINDRIYLRKPVDSYNILPRNLLNQIQKFIRYIFFHTATNYSIVILQCQTNSLLLQAQITFPHCLTRYHRLSLMLLQPKPTTRSQNQCHMF